jgi:HEAT repeat protein
MGSAARPALPELVARLESIESDERFEILTAIQQIAPVETTVPLLVEHLRDDDHSSHCIDLFAKIGEAAIPKLQEASRGDDVNRRRCVAFTLARIDSDAELLLSTLLNMAGDEDEEIRTTAYWALGRRGSKARRALPLLKERLSEKSNEARISAATAYWQVGGDAGLAAPVIIAAAASDESAQGRVAETIEKMRRSAVEALVAAMAQEDHDGFTRGRLAFTLGGIGHEAADAVPALTQQLADKHHYARAGAAYALGEIGPASAPHVKQLATLLADPDTFVRVKAVAAMWRIDQTKRD